ncbi:MAG: sodium:calcium antiporter [Bacteriovoracaceae bacterium]|jgi:cation:H+ antiporter|nr:sodium:calcium antiporter [Bacteriovoracaceae bacterium]
MIIAILLIILSVAFLYFGAEFSLTASEKIGNKIGLSPLAIGMFLVGFGTSLPEFFVSHIDAASGGGQIAIGALVGSNIANLLLILSVGAFFVPLALKSKELLDQLIIHFILCFLLLGLFSLNDSLDLVSVFCLGTLFLFYIFNLFRQMKSECKEHDVEIRDHNIKLFFMMLLGFALLYFGGELLVKGANDLCYELQISPYIVSSIFVAFGTSFPELVTVLIASFKKKDTDLIIGNILGSNIFNCSFVLGSIGFYDIPLKADLSIELVVLLFGAFYLIFLNLLKKSFNKFSGVIFVFIYILVVMNWLKLIKVDVLWI